MDLSNGCRMSELGINYKGHKRNTKFTKGLKAWAAAFFRGINKQHLWRRAPGNLLPYRGRISSVQRNAVREQARIEKPGNEQVKHLIGAGEEREVPGRLYSLTLIQSAAQTEEKREEDTRLRATYCPQGKPEQLRLVALGASSRVNGCRCFGKKCAVPVRLPP